MFEENQTLSVGKADMSSKWTEGEDSERVEMTESLIILLAASLNISFGLI